MIWLVGDDVYRPALYLNLQTDIGIK